MIQVSQLTKHYGTAVALDRLTVGIPQGSIFGLVGPNASGKSTLIKLLMGFIFPEEGKIDLGGLTPRQIGYMPERPHFSPRASLLEYLETIGRLAGLRGAALSDAIHARLLQLGIAHAANWRINACSKGMLNRLALAAALLNDPPLLLLDEPTSGLDPGSQKELRDFVRTLPAEGKTVLFSTHRLSEVSDLCSHIAILNRGKLVRSGVLQDVLPLRPRVVIRVDHLPATLAAQLATRHSAITISENTIILDDAAAVCRAEILQVLLEARVDIRSLEHQQTTLEELYLEAVRA